MTSRRCRRTRMWMFDRDRTPGTHHSLRTLRHARPTGGPGGPPGPNRPGWIRRLAITHTSVVRAVQRLIPGPVGEEQPRECIVQDRGDSPPAEGCRAGPVDGDRGVNKAVGRSTVSAAPVSQRVDARAGSDSIDPLDVPRDGHVMDAWPRWEPNGRCPLDPRPTKRQHVVMTTHGVVRSSPGPAHDARSY